MAVQRSIAATAQGLSQRIIRYVETEYLGKTPELLAACKQDLEQPGVLYQHPYLEATPAYKNAAGGRGRLRSARRKQLSAKHGRGWEGRV